MTNIELNKQRLYYIDWLRVLAFGLLFVFHSMCFFHHFPWMVKNPEKSIFASFMVGFLHGWRMHLIFFVSGVGSFFALRSRKELFIKDRFKRLLIPFLFGILLIVPPQKYLQAIQRGIFEGSFFDFILSYPSFLLKDFPGFSLEFTGHIGLHIWYLAFLFIMTMVFLPILKSVARNSKLSSYINKINEKKLGLLSFIIIAIILDLILRPIYPDYRNWADFINYGLFFLLGYSAMIYSNIVTNAKRYTYLFLGVGVLVALVYLFLYSQFPKVQNHEASTSFYLYIIFSNLTAFCWVMFFFGLSQRKLNFNHKLLPSLNIGILPFYILHQTVIVVIGFYVIPFRLGIFNKFLIILSLSMVSTVLLYQLIRKVNFLRYVFGMKKI